VNLTRDRFELALLHWALSCSLPVLGVCRGMQLLVAAHGGSMYQDLREMTTSHPEWQPVSHRTTNHGDTAHWVDLEPWSLLNQTSSRKHLMVNSHHHQGIRTLPARFSVSARSRDGLIEAIEGSNGSFIFGVQWHPERWEDASSEAIMKRFLSECSSVSLF
jgi:gamma-glutamyl-gamma-aminobutyrate hydrolase PuuD